LAARATQENRISKAGLCIGVEVCAQVRKRAGTGKMNSSRLGYTLGDLVRQRTDGAALRA